MVDGLAGRMPQMTIELPQKEYFKIGEVAALVGVKPYVLRYWESEFKRDIRPERTRSNQRMYRRRDVETFLEIKRLRYEEKLELPGARKRLRGGSAERAASAKEVAGSVEAGAHQALAVIAGGSAPVAAPVEAIDRERTERQPPGAIDGADDGGLDPRQRHRDPVSDRTMRGLGPRAAAVWPAEQAAGPAAHALAPDLAGHFRQLRQSIEEVIRIVDEDEKRG